MPSESVSSLLAFLDASPTPDHAAAAGAARLRDAGFAVVDLADPPRPVGPGFRGLVHRGGTLIAFRVGAEPIQEGGFRIVAAHTDSPNLRVKPQPAIRGSGYVRLGVEVYGGVTVATWTDRDLGMAGAVVVRFPDGGRPSRRLVDLRRPLCRVPNLAIHLNRKVNDEGLLINAQTQLPAVLMMDDPGAADPLRELLGAELGVPADAVLTWDLSLYDLTPATLAGARAEFVHSARLDNLASCHAGLWGLERASAGPLPASTAVLALFDHEEIGSLSARGADSRTVEDVLGWIAANAELQAKGSLTRAYARSAMISADMAHAVHPGWADKHDPQHMPKLNGGPVIKQNVNQRYATESETAAMFQLLCESVEAPVQWFVNRTDLACGTTVGPMLAARLGVRAVDVGNAMLSMHSAREMAGAADHPWMAAALGAFFAGVAP